MTESEAWDSLAAHLRDKNYAGVLVIADWFQENGQEEVAVYLRWSEKRGRLPKPDLIRFNDMPTYSNCWAFYYTDETYSHCFWIKPESFKSQVISFAVVLKGRREWYCD